MLLYALLAQQISLDHLLCHRDPQFNRAHMRAVGSPSAGSFPLSSSAKRSSQTFGTRIQKFGGNNLKLGTQHNTSIKIRCQALQPWIRTGGKAPFKAKFPQCRGTLQRGPRNAVFTNCKQLPRCATVWDGFCLLYI